MRPDGSYVSLCRCELDPRGLDQKQTTLPFWSIFGAGQGRLGTGKRNRSNDLDLICVHLEGRRSIQLSYGRTVQSILPSSTYSHFLKNCSFKSCGFRKFRHVNSGNSGTVWSPRQDLLQVEMTRSPRGSVEMNKASSF
jgi:hypothetical protein